MRDPLEYPQAQEALDDAQQARTQVRLAVVLPRWRWMLAGGVVFAVSVLDFWVRTWTAFGELLGLALTAGGVLLALTGRVLGAARLLRKRAQLSRGALRSVGGFVLVVTLVVATLRYMLLFLLPTGTDASGYWTVELLPGLLLGVLLAAAGPASARWWFRPHSSIRGDT